MKPYLLGQGVFHFVDGLVSCPPSLISNCSVDSSSTISPSFLRWKQHDQLILSSLLSSLCGCIASRSRLSYLAMCLANSWESSTSPSNSHIMQLHGSFQDLRQGVSSVSIYIQQAKSLFDKLGVAGRPMSLEDFNLYVFRGLRGEFKDLITSLITKAKSMSYADLLTQKLYKSGIKKLYKLHYYDIINCLIFFLFLKIHSLVKILKK